MKTQQPVLITPITAGADLVARRFVGFDGNLCGANIKALGVSDLATKSGEQAPVITVGVALVESGGVISAGAAVASDSSGRAVAASALAAAAPAITYDASKVTIGATKITVDSGSTPVTSSAANGDILTPASDAISIATGAVIPAAPVLSGGYTPQATNGWALDAAGGAGEFIRVLLK